MLPLLKFGTGIFRLVSTNTTAIPSAKSMEILGEKRKESEIQCRISTIFTRAQRRHEFIVWVHYGYTICTIHDTQCTHDIGVGFALHCLNNIYLINSTTLRDLETIFGTYYT